MILLSTLTYDIVNIVWVWWLKQQDRRFPGRCRRKVRPTAAVLAMVLITPTPHTAAGSRICDTLSSFLTIELLWALLIQSSTDTTSRLSMLTSAVVC